MGKVYDALIIGKGPAGSTCAMYLARAGKSTLVVAKDGGALEKAGAIDNYYALPGLNGSQLLERGVAQAQSFGAEYVNDEAVGVTFDGTFTVKCLKETYRARTVVLCCGAKREKLTAKNAGRFDGAGVSWCVTCDGFIYRNKRVGLVGGGDYMLAELDELRAFTDKITVFTQSSDVEVAGAQTVRENITSLEGDEKLRYVEAGGKKYELDGLFIAIGTAGGADFARTLGVFTDSTNVTAKDGVTNMPGFFAAGDCTAGIKQVVKAASDGAVAAAQVLRYLREKASEEKDEAR
ncbi:MAG TPA: FAD-dependent oxidoreductase [Bacillota bacterium]|nr:FAD-dependent oxidoreductase [Bacillota bacterium]